MTFDEMISLGDPGLYDFYRDYESEVSEIPGSSHNHQAWPGGYRDHLAECGTIAEALFESLSEIRELPFAFEDAITVLLLHDIEKVKRAPGAESDPLLKLAYLGNASSFKQVVIETYRIRMSPEMANALRYVHGEPDSEHSKDRRVAGRLAAFVHCCDYLSARMWHDEPKASA